MSVLPPRASRRIELPALPTAISNPRPSPGDLALLTPSRFLSLDLSDNVRLFTPGPLTRGELANTGEALNPFEQSFQLPSENSTSTSMNSILTPISNVSSIETSGAELLAVAPQVNPDFAVPSSIAQSPAMTNIMAQGNALGMTGTGSSKVISGSPHSNAIDSTLLYRNQSRGVMSSAPFNSQLGVDHMSDIYTTAPPRASLMGSVNQVFPGAGPQEPLMQGSFVSPHQTPMHSFETDTISVPNSTQAHGRRLYSFPAHTSNPTTMLSQSISNSFESYAHTPAVSVDVSLQSGSASNSPQVDSDITVIGANDENSFQDSRPMTGFPNSSMSHGLDEDPAGLSGDWSNDDDDLEDYKADCRHMSGDDNGLPPVAPSEPKRKRRPPTNDPVERKRRALERNRVAASKCRQKKKAWIKGLEQELDDKKDENRRLRTEIDHLRNEICRLKAQSCGDRSTLKRTA